MDSDPKSDNSLEKLISEPSEPGQPMEDIHNGDIVERFEGNGEGVGGEKDMDFTVDLVQGLPVQERSIELIESIAMVEKVNEDEVRMDTDNGFAVTSESCSGKNHSVDESPIAGVKRVRLTHVDVQPSVRVVYSSLTRESKKRLMELLQQWSEWHARRQYSSNDEYTEEALEHGEETYFPALHVGFEKSSTVSFWLDNQSRIDDTRECQVDNASVPLYDRGCTLGSTLLDGSTDHDRIGTLEASRCFNCGSYNHAMKECPKPRDNVAINNARKQHSSKRNQAPGSRAPARYYQKSPGKFDDLKAGVLGPETREALGIGEFDPPPWLQRMRDIGYPPGYLDIVEDEDCPSGIMIFGDEENVECEEGELPEKGEPEPPEKQMTVDFPGINAPIPENADRWLWAATNSGYSGSNSYKSRSHSRSNRPSDPQRGSYHDQRWSADDRDDGPPGTKYGSASRDGSSYDHNRRARSPTFGRSVSDRSSPRSPYPYNSMSRQSPPHDSYSAGMENRSHENRSSSSSDISAQRSRDRHDHHRYHRR